jgi:hypothetical protein
VLKIIKETKKYYPEIEYIEIYVQPDYIGIYSKN